MKRAMALLIPFALMACVPSTAGIPVQAPWSSGPVERGGPVSAEAHLEEVMRTAIAEVPHASAEPRGGAGGTAAASLTTRDATALEAAVLESVNAARLAAGARPLRPGPDMQRAARQYSRELAGHGLIDHLSTRPGRRTFRQRLEAEGVRARIAGENLARLTAVPRDLGERVVASWMRSPDHRKNMLDPIFARTGIGVWLGTDGVWYIVHLLATGD